MAPSPSCPHCGHPLSELEQKDILLQIKHHRADPNWRRAQVIAAGKLSRGGGVKAAVAIGSVYGQHFCVVGRLPSDRHGNPHWEVRCTHCGARKNTDTKKLRHGPLKCKQCKICWGI